MISTEQVQNVLLDDDERKLINTYRMLRDSHDFGDIIAKIHRKRLVAVYATAKWNADAKPTQLREVIE